MLIARSLFGSPISGHALISSDLSSSANRSNQHIVFAGDSTTEPNFSAKWDAVAAFFRSDAQDLTAGIGTLTLYDDSTATWAAFGDTAGARTPVGEGFVWIESDSPDMGACFNIPASVAASGTALGFAVPVEVEASSYIGSKDVAPATFGGVFSGQVFEPSANMAIDGETCFGLSERIAQVFTVDSYGRPSSKRPSVVFVLIGINDVNYIAGGGLDYDMDDVKGWVTDIKNSIVANGAIAVFGNLVKESPTAGEIALIAEFNGHLDTLAAASPSRIKVADFHTACNGVASAMDGSHFTGKGAKLAGQELADILIDLAGSAGRSNFRYNSGFVVNGNMAGEDGFLYGGLTGVSAVNALIDTATGSGVASKEAVAGEHDWQVFTLTGMSNGDTLAVFLDLDGAAVGDTIYSEVEIQITGDGVLGASSSITANNFDASVSETVYSCFSNFSESSPGASGIYRTNPYRLNDWYSIGAAGVIVFVAAGDHVVKVRNFGAAIYS